MQLVKRLWTLAKHVLPIHHAAVGPELTKANFTAGVLRTKPRDVVARWKAGLKKDSQGQRLKVEARQKFSLENALNRIRSSCQKQNHGAPLFWENFQKNTWASQLRRTAAMEHLGCKRRVYYSLIPFAFSGKWMLTEISQESDEQCLIENLKAAVETAEYGTEPELVHVAHVEELNFNKYISKGCEGAVFEVSRKNSASLVTGSSIRETSLDHEVNFGTAEFLNSSFERADSNLDSNDTLESNMQTLQTLWADLNLAPPAVHTSEQSSEDGTLLACKIMYNFDTPSHATLIEDRFRNEILPLRLRGEFGLHPNLVHIHGAFSARIPHALAADGAREFGVALPPRLCSEGAGRNMTRFVIMKRYDCTLSGYVQDFGTPPPEVATYLLLQLLQAISFLQRCHVAHRDIKPNNLLLSLDTVVPLLALADFGLALDEGTLQVPFNSRCVSRGGAPAVMAPEIYEAEPGPRSVLDYRSSDVWAAGLIGRQLLRCADVQRAEDTAVLSDCPKAVERCVQAMLERNPRKRISAVVACDVLCAWLWRFSNPVESATGEHRQMRHLAGRALTAWCEVLTVEVCSRQSAPRHSLHHGPVARQAKSLFLKRLDLRRLKFALQFCY